LRRRPGGNPDLTVRLDPDLIEQRLAAIEEHVAQCRAVVQTAREGDPTALQELGPEVDAMAEVVAELRSVSTSPL
jgi:hypothetical protein